MAEAAATNGASIYDKIAAPDVMGSFNALMSAANGAQQNRLLQGQVEVQQPAIDNAKLDNALRHQQFVSSQMTPILAKAKPGPDGQLGLSPADIWGHASEAVAASRGVVSPQEITSFAARVTSDPNPSAVYAAITRENMKVLDNIQQIQALRGGNMEVDDGLTKRQFRQDTYSGNLTPRGGPGAAVPTYPTRASMVTPVTGPPDASGAPSTMPAGAYGEQMGVLPPGAYTQYRRGGSAASGAPGTPHADGNPAPPPLGSGGSLNPYMARTSVGGSVRTDAQGRVLSGQAPAAVAQPSTMTVGLPPGQGEAARVSGTGSAEMLNRDRTSAANFASDTTPLATAIPLLEKLGPTGTGPATEKLNGLKSLAISLGVPGAGAMTDSVKAYDEVKKYLTQSALRGDTATNDKLAATFAGNPSVGISNAAATDVAKTALALRRMQHAGYLANALPGHEATYADRAAQWNSRQDPRAFGVDMMTPAARQAMVQGMGGPSSPAYQKFRASVAAGIRAGVIDPQALSGGR